MPSAALWSARNDGNQKSFTTRLSVMHIMCYRANSVSWWLCMVATVWSHCGIRQNLLNPASHSTTLARHVGKESAHWSGGGGGDGRGGGGGFLTGGGGFLAGGGGNLRGGGGPCAGGGGGPLCVNISAVLAKVAGA